MPHEAYYNTKNEEIPSVTQILKILNKKGLIEWSNFLGFKRIKYKELLNEKALLGTLVHGRIEQDLLEQPYTPFIDVALEREVDKRFSLYKKWKSDVNLLCSHSELRLTNDRYGGTIDCIGYMNDELSVIDFKTSKKPQFTHMMQLGGYLNLIEYNRPEIYEKLTGGAIICFPDKSTSYITKAFTKETLLEYKNAFESLYTAFIALEKISNYHWKESLI